MNRDAPWAEICASLRKHPAGSGFEVPEVEEEWVAMDPLFQPTGITYLVYGRVMYTLQAIDGSNRGWRKVEKLPDQLPPFKDHANLSKGDVPC